MKLINSLKVALAEQNKIGKWLAETLGQNKANVSLWCTNESQPSLETLVKVANELRVGVKDLLVSTNKQDSA